MIAFENISERVSEDRLAATLTQLVDVPSPTGEEGAIANTIVDIFEGAGIAARTQFVSNTQANAVASLTGSAPGPELLLCAPTDTVTSNTATEDVPWAHATLRPDMQASAYQKDGHIYGLGAHNPKGHAACVIEAARVLNTLNQDIQGTIHFGFCAGGMPTHSRSGFDGQTGHGIGCQTLAKSLPDLDGAIIAKSGTSVTWEEVGFIWMDVEVSGTHTYVGSRHLLSYENAIAQAGRLIGRLEDWFEDYAAAHQTDCVYPQGVVSHIEGGWARMPAFTPACCRFKVDLRFGPADEPNAIEQEFRSVVERTCANLGITATARRIQTIPASHTPPSDPVIEATIASWESVHKKSHEPFTLMSGATDANILRDAGIPTARIGLPKANLPDLDFQLGMNCVSIEAMSTLTTLLVGAALNYGARVKNG